MTPTVLAGKNIHFVVPRYHTNMVPWVTALIKAGAQVTMDVVTIGPTEDHELLTPNVLVEGRLSRWLNRWFADQGANRPRLFPGPIDFYRHLRSQNPDVLVIRDPSRFVSMLCLIVSFRLQAQVVLYNQAAVDRVVTPYRKWLIRITNHVFKARWMSPVSTSFRMDARSMQPGHHFVPFVSEIRSRSKAGLHRPIRLLCIGKFEPRKNQAMLIQALHVIREKGYDVRLTLVGEVSMPKHRSTLDLVTDRITSNGLSDVVELQTNVPHSAISAFYSNTDLFILPATAESASVSVIEALSHGLPVICSDTNGTRCYIDPGVNGDLFEDGNIASLIDHIVMQLERMMCQPEDYFAKCRDTSAGRVSPDAFLDAFINLVA